MKAKCQPEDFRVEEIAQVRPDTGPFSLYRLTKHSLGTPEAIDAICRAWRLRRETVGIGGLKDRHAVTQQYVSIESGPRRRLAQKNFSLEYLGQMSREFTSKDILANRFEIVLRDLEPSDAERIVRELPSVIAEGVPNYFDDQRFGSVGESGDFVARPWCLGDYERTLWLAIAEANEHDRGDVRDEKRALRDRWGDWPACRQSAVRPVSRAVFERLCRQPGDFRGAFVRIPQPDRRMYLAAFQSELWNRILAETVRGIVDSTELFPVEIGRQHLPFYRTVRPPVAVDVLSAPLPLPCARERHELGPRTELYERVAAEFGLECRTLRVKFPRDSFFSRGSRAAVFRPQSLSDSIGPDELAGGADGARSKLTLRFDLPPGCYATVLVKRLTETPRLPPAAASL
jgi:tRNA pseudouridine13 synthase